MNEKIMQVGLNVHYNGVMPDHPKFMLTTQNATNIDFALCHVDVMNYTLKEACERVEALSKKFGKLGIRWAPNFECVNGRSPATGPDGYDWATRADGTHRMHLTKEFADALKSGGTLSAVLYDEFEHMIINVNPTITRRTKGKVSVPAFHPAKTGGALEQAALLDKQLKEYLSEMKEAGVDRLAGEHVFQALYHMFARNGIIPNFKSQKESYTTVQFALAAGAAIQYNMPLWNCVDLWFMDFHPGHSAEEMYNNLVFAYLSGVNTAYVESCGPMVKDDQLTPYGEKFIAFASEYKGKARCYDVHDYAPEVGIIRFDDTYWGASGIVWKKLLFGNKRLRPSRASYEYLRAFHLITHGETNKNGINWGRLTLWSFKKHRSFSTMNSAVVFDETVRKEHLSSLKLCFLCGEYISPETLEDVEALVKENGLTVVTTKRFLPDRIKKQRKMGLSKIKDGNGLWIVTPGFLYPPLKKLLKPMLGKKGEMRLTFKDRVITMKIDEDGNGFTVL